MDPLKSLSTASGRFIGDLGGGTSEGFAYLLDYLSQLDAIPIEIAQPMAHLADSARTIGTGFRQAEGLLSDPQAHPLASQIGGQYAQAYDLMDMIPGPAAIGMAGALLRPGKWRFSFGKKGFDRPPPGGAESLTPFARREGVEARSDWRREKLGRIADIQNTALKRRGYSGDSKADVWNEVRELENRMRYSRAPGPRASRYLDEAPVSERGGLPTREIETIPDDAVRTHIDDADWDVENAFAPDEMVESYFYSGGRGAIPDPPDADHFPVAGEYYQAVGNWLRRAMDEPTTDAETLDYLEDYLSWMAGGSSKIFNPQEYEDLARVLSLHRPNWVDPLDPLGDFDPDDIPF